MVSEEIVIFKVYYEYDNKKPEELSLEEMGEHMSLYQRLFYQKAKNSARVSRSTMTIQKETFVEKETATGRVKKSKRGHK